MPVHNVEQGDCLLSIAEEHGFFWETLWDHPKNAELKKKRKDPAILFPGDEVFVPDKRLKELNEPTNQVHKYRLKNVPAKFHVRLLDDDGKPRANLEYVLEIEGKEFKGKTDSEGAIKISVPPGAKTGRLVLVSEDEEYELALGSLDPIEEITGVQARLRGLGYYDETVDGELTPETEEAVREFQEDYKLEITGKIDDSLRNKLKSVYGS
jgi:hypothetical protein